MEQKFDNKAVADHRVIRIGAEEDYDKSIRCRSGLLIGRGPFEPAKVTVLSNEKVKIHSLGDEDTFGVIYPAVLDELDPLDDGEVETVITPDDYPLPKEGHIGYVKFENPQEYAELCEPRLFDVDEYRFEVVG